MHDPITGLVKLASALSADEILLIAPPEHTLSQRLMAAGGPKPTDAGTLTTHPPDKRYRLALVAGYLEILPQGNCEHLISSLRDLYAETLYCLTDPAIWPAIKMAALGLRPVGIFPKDTGRLALYHFDLYDYKRTPDWLNAKYWAHPERWGKTRW